MYRFLVWCEASHLHLRSRTTYGHLCVKRIHYASERGTDILIYFIRVSQRNLKVETVRGPRHFVFFKQITAHLLG